MLRKMYLIPADLFHGSSFMSREPTAVSKRKHRETIKKRDSYAEAKMIRKHHPYEEWLKMRKKIDNTVLFNTVFTDASCTHSGNSLTA